MSLDLFAFNCRIRVIREDLPRDSQRRFASGRDPSDIGVISNLIVGLSIGNTLYVYNSADRLAQVLLPDGSTATYSYDPFGRRIRKDVDGEVTYYLYSDEGLIGEYDAGGGLKKGYGWKQTGIWGTDPVFMTEGGSYYFYENDHLGTPQKLFDQSGAVVWSAEYTAYGDASINPSSTVENNLRFPGQYFDEETNLHYNWSRYYSPDTGRYLEVDPLRFKGRDFNLYRYVRNNPVHWKDPKGKFINLGAAGVGAVIGGSVGAVNALFTHGDVFQGAMYGAGVGALAGFSFGTSRW